MNDSFFSNNQTKEVDSINSYFECITRCLEVHLKGGYQDE